ncbi:GD24154 [Drosophila simulans]|uniref:GD24154 n=1 Tax=Drosophila simulans TaxID=7240 RepID=B4Q8Y0_DROSI|nr:GD24154 [Drosophila simulans]
MPKLLWRTVQLINESNFCSSNMQQPQMLH